ncbi:MAG: Rhs family protein, partial [Parcubacteria group bacterium Greene0714_2]
KAGDVEYDYDESGQLESKGAEVLNWNEKGQIVSWKKGNTEVFYGYDAGGNRVWKRKKVTSGEGENLSVVETKTMYWSGDYRILENGNIEKEFEWGLVRWVDLSRHSPATGGTTADLNGSLETYFLDPAKTVLGKFDSTGIWTDLSHRSFSEGGITAYGEKANSSHGPRPFAGHIHEDESDLFYMNARYYDPAIGRWAN